MIRVLLPLIAICGNGGLISSVTCAQSKPALKKPAGVAVKAQHNPSACKISFSNGSQSWCGSGALAGFDTDGAGLIMTNAHVSGSPSDVNARRTARFRRPDGAFEDFDAKEVIAYAYNDRLAVDWAVLRCPKLDKAKADSIGVPTTPLLKERPSTNSLEFTGSPRCVWPQTNVDIKTFERTGLPPGVIFWNPITIGGQSGSNVRAKVDGKWVGQIVLTWSWAGAGAGQETAQIYKNIVGRNADGPARATYETDEAPGGLVEVARNVDEYTLDTGYFESRRISEALGLKPAYRDWLSA